jgi:hypothetical protein
MEIIVGSETQSGAAITCSNPENQTEHHFGVATAHQGFNGSLA